MTSPGGSPNYSSGAHAAPAVSDSGSVSYPATTTAPTSGPGAGAPSAADLDPSHAPDALALRQFAALGELTLELVEAAARDGALAFWVADDYLRATALALLAWAWARIERTLAAEGADRARQWLPAARAMRHWVLPEFDMRASIIRARCTASEAARTD